MNAKERSTLAVLLTAALLIVALGVSHLVSRHRDAERQAAAELATIAEFKVRQLTSWLAERRADAQAAARTPQVQAAIRSLLSQPAEARIRDDLRAWLAGLHGAYAYQALALYDPAGKLLVDYPAGRAPRGAPVAAWVQAAVRTREPQLTDLYRDPTVDQPRLGLLQPLGTDPNGVPGAVLLLQNDPAAFLYPLLQEWPRPSATAETLLVRREGDAVLVLNELRHATNGALTLRLPVTPRPALLAAQAVTGRTGSVKGEDYRGVPVMGELRPVPGTAWFLIAKMNRTEAFGAGLAADRQAAVSVGLGLLALFLGGGWWWRQLRTDQLAQRFAAAEALRRKDRRIISLMQETNDIIVIFDEQFHVVDCNDRALLAYGYGAGELRGLPAQAFHPPEALASEAENLRQFQSAEGACYETLHRRKDGSVFPVEIGGRAVHTDGHFEIIAVIRDITRRKREEEQVAQLGRLYAALSGINQAIVKATAVDALFAQVCEVLVHQGGFRLAWVGWIDPATRLIQPRTVVGDPAGYVQELRLSLDPDLPEGRGPSGTALREHRVYVCNDFTADPNTGPWRAAAERAGLRSSIALPLRRGGQVPGVLSVYAGEPNHFGEKEVALLREAADDLSFALDNLERDQAAARAQQTLREREELLAAIFGQAADAIALVELATGRFAEFNEAAHRNLGYTHAEFAQLTVANIEAGHTLAQIRENFATMQAHPTGLVLEVRHRRRDGTLRDVRLSARGLQVRGRAYIVSVWTDITERRQAEQVLRDSEERFRRLFEQAPIPLAISSGPGGIIYLNSQFTRTFGYATTDLPTLDCWWPLAYPDEAYRREMAARWSRATQRSRELGGPVESTECRVTCKDGTVRTVEISASELADELMVTFFDLTERRATEDALLQEQEFTRALLENLDAGVVACDAAGRLRLFNRAARAWHGLGPQELDQAEWAGCYHLFEADGRTPMTPATIPLARALRGDQVQGSPMVIAAPGQPRRHLVANASPVVTADGRRIGAVAVMHDLTDQREAQARLLLQSAALNAAANAIVITDRGGHIVWANDAFSRHTGYTLAEALGQNPRLLKSGVQSAEFYAQLWSTVTAGRVWHGELKNRRKDGTVFEEEMTITPVHANGDAITHFIAIKHDITERRLLEKQYLRAQRMEGLGLLAGGIAHDLNNVLSPILMSVELLRWSELPADLLRIVETINDSAKRGAAIVRQVLTFARGGEGEKHPLQLRHLVKEIVALLSETFPRNVSLRSRLPGDLALIRGDATQLHQVLLNLCVNARDAMTQGGDLIFSGANVELDEAAARTFPDLDPGAYVRLEVSDTGTGIPPEIVNRIFDPFFTTKDQGKGTGLGLSTVMGIVKGHRGAITVDSTPGRGTRFTLFLPALPVGDEPAGISAPRPRRPPGRNELVLLVDDEPGILTIAEALLTNSGYRVLKAMNGVEALVVFLQHQAEIAAVVTDIMMPTMDGVTLVAELRHLKPGLPCIAASGLLEAGDQARLERLKALGVTEFLSKPFTAEALLGALDQSLH